MNHSYFLYFYISGPKQKHSLQGFCNLFHSASNSIPYYSLLLNQLQELLFVLLKFSQMMMIYFKTSNGSSVHQVKAKIDTMTSTSPHLPQLHSSPVSQHAHSHYCACTFALSPLPGTLSPDNMLYFLPSDLCPTSGWISVKDK